MKENSTKTQKKTDKKKLGLFGLLEKKSKIAQTLMAFFMFITLIFSIFFFYIQFQQQQEFYEKSLKPILQVAAISFEDKIEIFLKNHGNGPIVKCSIMYESDSIKTNKLNGLLKTVMRTTNLNVKLDRDFIPYYVIQGSSILSLASKSEQLIFSLTPTGNSKFEPSEIEILTKALNKITLSFEFEDLYGNSEAGKSRILFENKPTNQQK